MSMRGTEGCRGPLWDIEGAGRRVNFGRSALRLPPLPRAEGWQVSVLGVGWWVALAVIVVPAAPVLVGRTPHPQYAMGRAGVIPSTSSGSMRCLATVHTCSQVSEVELVGESLAGLETAQGQAAAVTWLLVRLLIGVGQSHPGAVREPELMQVGLVPPGERVIDRGGQFAECVTPGGGHDPARPGPQPLATSFDEFYADGEPGPRHPGDSARGYALSGAVGNASRNESGLSSFADGEGEEGIDRGFDRAAAPVHLGE